MYLKGHAISGVVIALVLSGCAADLDLRTDMTPSQAENHQLAGIPFRVGEQYVFTYLSQEWITPEKKVLTKDGKPAIVSGEPYCRRTVEVKMVTLPSVDVRYINFDANVFAKSDFAVTLNQDATLKEVKLNTSSPVKDVTDSLVGIAGTAVGLSKGGVPSDYEKLGADIAPQFEKPTDKRTECIEGQSIIKTQTLEKWLAENLE